MEDTEKSKNKEMAINDNKYKDLRCFLKVSFIMENLGKNIDLISKLVYNIKYNEAH